MNFLVEEMAMATCHLRVFPYVEEAEEIPGQEASVSIRLSEVFPVIQNALENDATWLRDFADDEVVISPDLFQVVRALSEVRPTA